jgi:hypothetical protein
MAYGDILAYDDTITYCNITTYRYTMTYGDIMPSIGIMTYGVTMIYCDIIILCGFLPFRAGAFAPFKTMRNRRGWKKEERQYCAPFPRQSTPTTFFGAFLLR